MPELLAILLFYSKGVGKQRWFCGDIKHCNCIILENKQWVFYESRAGQIEHRILKIKNGARIARNCRVLSHITDIVCVEIREIPKHKWFPLTVFSCSNVMKWLTQVDIGFTLNPGHMLKKLVRLDGERNYRILNRWRKCQAAEIQTIPHTC